MSGWYPNRDPNPTYAEHMAVTNRLDTVSTEVVGVTSI